MKSEAICHAFPERAYAMKKHHATRLHYDLRLEWNGVLLSWAIPGELGLQAGEIREAAEMADHRREHLSFEGVHETGPIMLWDRGTWRPHPESGNIESSLRMGVLQFTLCGEKLKGDWTLRRTKREQNASRPIWMLSKQPDSFAEYYLEKCVLREWEASVSTGRMMEEIVRDWTTPKRQHKQQMRLFDLI